MMTWTVHPAKQRPQDAALAAMIVLVAGWAVMVSLGSALLAVLAIVLLLVAITPFLAPTHYSIDDTRVIEKRLFVTRMRPFTELRRLEVGKTAAFVSPYREKRALDRYRGIVILLPPDGARVVSHLRAKIA